MSKNLYMKKIGEKAKIASLELAKNGFIDVKQNEVFGNIFIKVRS